MGSIADVGTYLKRCAAEGAVTQADDCAHCKGRGKFPTCAFCGKVYKRGADKAEWVEYAELGVAVREVGTDKWLQVRATRLEGRQHITAAIYAAYPTAENNWPTLLGCEGSAWAIDPAHRLAFTRALGLSGRVEEALRFCMDTLRRSAVTP